jgi:hypothetical protein
MEHEGPLLESLIHRLAETPVDFLAEPHIGRSGQIHVAAVVGDLLSLLGDSPEKFSLGRYAGGDARRDRNWLAITLLLCWLLADEWFRRAKPKTSDVLRLLETDATELAAQAASMRFVTDPDRREELARLTLARLGFRPAGETVAQAQDRLTTLNSTERARVMQASRAAEERARKIREALVKKAAEESADKYTRE